MTISSLPLPFTAGFWECPLDVVADAFVEWRQKLGQRIKREPIKGDLPELLQHLTPLQHIADKYLLVATKSNWTAYFDNGVRGTDATSPIGHLCTVLNCRGLVARSVPDTIRKTSSGYTGLYGAVDFTLLADHPTEWLNIQRCVSVLNDGGRWKFFQRGKPLEFENPVYFQAKAIRQWFTPQMLEEYCKAVGVDVFNSDFYGSEAVLLKVRDLKRLFARGTTLQDAQKGFGLPK